MTPKSPDDSIDTQAAHRVFSVQCFNKTWELIEKPNRTREDEDEMLRLTLASHWHWTQRKDYTPVKGSIGYWQISRVFALLGQPDNARRFAQRSLDAIAGTDPFFTGYAYEALARAESIAGNTARAQDALERARKLAEEVKDPEDRQLLVADLATIKLPT
jgi:hypothetical protein